MTNVDVVLPKNNTTTHKYATVDNNGLLLCIENIVVVVV